MLVVKLMFSDSDQVADLAHHAQDLRRCLMLHRVVELFYAQRLDRILLTLWPIDGTSRLRNCNLAHSSND